jgi:glycogen operon protein
VISVRVWAPAASSITLVELDRGGGERGRMKLERDTDGVFTGDVPEGTVYGLVAEGDGPGFDPSKVLLDPWATEVWFPPGHDRALAAARGVDNTGRGPLAIARAPGPRRPSRRSSRGHVVYEAHVRGMTRRRDVDHPGTFTALVVELPRLQQLGVTVVELLPVHQNDPQEGSYWGYMPLAFGAVHRQYAATDDAAEELAAFIAAAHDHDIEVWLDVVFNHTTEVDPQTGPTYSQRGLDEAAFYRLRGDGSYIETTGCGNDIDVTSPVARDLILASLERLADLGVDGFRFDLAAVLTHDRHFVASLTAWAAERDVVLVAEPWDAVGTHLLGHAWPSAGWRHWNDGFREAGRGFLRAEPGMVPAMVQRVQGSPDLVAAPIESVNYLACHDGFTLYDLVAYDRKHNDANGWGGRDGTADERSWNCGWEGDAGAPPDVLAMRQRQLRNAWCLVMMSHGTPMVAMGDECGRTQGGNNNAYNQDNETSWFDWSRAAEFAELERFCAELVALRHRHPVLAQPQWWGDDVRFFGAGGPLDDAFESRSLAWAVGDLFVIANAWWEPLRFAVSVPGPWQRVVDTSLPSPDDIVPAGVPLPPTATAYDVAPRAVVILERATS